MADPAYPPTPCDTDTLLLHAIRCVPDGEGTKWVDVWVSVAEIVPSVARAGSPCGGGGCAKSEAIKTARERGWSAEELVKVLKAIG